MFWPFPLQRNHKSEETVTDLFLRIASRADLVVTEDRSLLSGECYTLIVQSALGTLKFWNQNKFYAWASSGSFDSSEGEDLNIAWKDVMPSRWAARQMWRAVRDHTSDLPRNRVWKGPMPPEHLRSLRGRAPHP